jgi:hypothetical protein
MSRIFDVTKEFSLKNDIFLHIFVSDIELSDDTGFVSKVRSLISCIVHETAIGFYQQAE